MHDSDANPHKSSVLEFHLDLNKEDLDQRDACLDRLQFSIRARFMTAISFAVLFAWVAYIVSVTGHPDLMFVFLVCFGVVLLNLLVSSNSLIPRRRKKSEYKPTTLTLTDECVLLADQLTQQKLRWGSIALVVHSPHGLLFCHDRRRSHFWLPMRVLEKDGVLKKVLYQLDKNNVRVRLMRQPPSSPKRQESATDNEGCYFEGSDLVFFGRISESDCYYIQKLGAFLFNPLWSRLLSTLLIAIAGACIAFTLHELVNGILAYIVGPVVVFFLSVGTLHPHRERNSSAKLYWQNESKFKHTKVILSARGLHYVTEVDERECAWEVVWTVIVTPEGVLFMSYAKVPMVWLATRQFTDAGAMDKLLEILKSNQVKVLHWEGKDT